jgi:hypothetical protein
MNKNNTKEDYIEKMGTTYARLKAKGITHICGNVSQDPDLYLDCINACLDGQEEYKLTDNMLTKILDENKKKEQDK